MHPPLVSSGEVTEKSERIHDPIVFLSPSQIRSFEVPSDYILLGDCHLVRGGITVIGGEAGVGKSRALVALAVAGATGQSWFGLDVRAKFKTAIFQDENGKIRLKQEFSDITEEGLDEHIRICEPPPYGLDFEDLSFCLKARSELKEFKPDLIAIDPFNSIAHDDRMADYRSALNAARRFVAGFEREVAIVIVAHTRKPNADDRPKGRRLLQELSGSYVLGSVPRCVFIMQHASTNPEDDRIVWTCCKNNDGSLGSPSAWRRRNGLFVAVEDFKIEDLEADSSPRRTVTADDIRAVLADGKTMTRSEVMKELMDRTHLAKSACYAALDSRGKYRDILEENNGLLRLKAQNN
jgi:hypothetical protein